MNKERLFYWSHILYDILRFWDKTSIYILGYPRSGTNWLTSLVSEYTGTPVSEPWKLSFPQFKSYIFHVHRFIPVPWIRSKTLYVVRDGRDIMVSFYFMIIRDPNKIRMKRDAEASMGTAMTVESIRENLPKFITYLTHNRTSSIDYKRHVQKALLNEYIIIRYEDLLEKGEEAFGASMEKINGSPPDMEKAKKTFETHSFQTKSGRGQGEEDTSAFHRKGIAGDWKNYFSPRAAKVFDEYAGNVLIQLGYEDSHDWVQETTD